MAILLKPFPLEPFRQIVSAGNRLPPKSTFFLSQAADGSGNQPSGRQHLGCEGAIMTTALAPAPAPATTTDTGIATAAAPKPSPVKRRRFTVGEYCAMAEGRHSVGRRTHRAD